jgi:Ni,Fe-hydrogenase III small subunit
MMSKLLFPESLQTRIPQKEIDATIAEAKAILLGDIKRSAFIYRVDCGGCNACEIEIFASLTPVFDVERFGVKLASNPRQADILVYTGAVTRSMRAPAVRAYNEAPEPKIVVSYGACGCTGGIFHDNYCVWGGTDKLFPVDLYIPGCPPSPAQTVYGFALALGHLGQKLKPNNHVEGADERVALAAGAVPYVVRVALERQARLMAGYRQGRALLDEFLEVVSSGGTGAVAALDARIAREPDARRAEIFGALRQVLLGYVAGH